MTGLSTAFNSPDLTATIFLPNNEAFSNLLSLTGMTTQQALSNTSAFLPYLGQAAAPCFIHGDACRACSAGPHVLQRHACMMRHARVPAQILEYHVIPNQVLYAANFSAGQTYTTVENETITVSVDPCGLSCCQPQDALLRQPSRPQHCAAARLRRTPSAWCRREGRQPQ